MKKNEPTIKRTEFLDGNGDVFAAVYGSGNIQTNGERGMITKRTIWSDGTIMVDPGVIYQTNGIPQRPDLESEKETYKGSREEHIDTIIINVLAKSIDESKVDILKVS